ncbi:MAG: phosphoglucosamine mutase [Schwartzia sp. (in: firmicutes)]
MARLFGTDGIRGEANLELTPELAYRLGRATALYFGEETRGEGEVPAILIGRDTRISGTMFEAALSAGICSAGGQAVLAGIIPTPGIAHLTKAMGFQAGIVVSASHNPFYDNGLKLFGGDGYKLPDPVEDEIEGLIQRMRLEDDLYRAHRGGVGTVEVRRDLQRRYIDFVKSTIDTRLDGLRVVLDCANGASYEVMPTVLRELGADLTVIHAAPYGTNINDNCGSTHLDSLRQTVLRYQADIGIALDGDADRCLCIDEKGDLMDGDHILVLCGLDMKKRGRLPKDTIVTTVMANIGFHQALKAAGIHVEITKVGDRYVLENMLSHGYALGGEQSGHIIFTDFATTGDGAVTALQVLQALMGSDQPASALNALMVSYPQLLLNVVVSSKEGWEENAAIQEAIRAGEAALGEKGRILVRPSGTEPLIRVMAEGSDPEQLDALCHRIADVVKQELG